MSEFAQASTGRDSSGKGMNQSPINKRPKSAPLNRSAKNKENIISSLEEYGKPRKRKHRNSQGDSKEIINVGKPVLSNNTTLLEKTKKYIIDTYMNELNNLLKDERVITNINDIKSKLEIILNTINRNKTINDTALKNIYKTVHELKSTLKNLIFSLIQTVLHDEFEKYKEYFNIYKSSENELYIIHDSIFENLFFDNTVFKVIYGIIEFIFSELNDYENNVKEGNKVFFVDTYSNDFIISNVDTIEDFEKKLNDNIDSAEDQLKRVKDNFSEDTDNEESILVLKQLDTPNPSIKQSKSIASPKPYEAFAIPLPPSKEEAASSAPPVPPAAVPPAAVPAVPAVPPAAPSALEEAGVSPQTVPPSTEEEVAVEEVHLDLVSETNQSDNQSDEVVSSAVASEGSHELREASATAESGASSVSRSSKLSGEVSQLTSEEASASESVLSPHDVDLEEIISQSDTSVENLESDYDSITKDNWETYYLQVFNIKKNELFTMRLFAFKNDKGSNVPFKTMILNLASNYSDVYDENTHKKCFIFESITEDNGEPKIDAINFKLLGKFEFNKLYFYA